MTTEATSNDLVARTYRFSIYDARQTDTFVGYNEVDAEDETKALAKARSAVENTGRWVVRDLKEKSPDAALDALEMPHSGQDAQ
jgi:hypothetical protein